MVSVEIGASAAAILFIVILIFAVTGIAVSRLTQIMLILIAVLSLVAAVLAFAGLI